MEIAQVIVELFSNVLNRKEILFNVSYESIRDAIANMKDAYLPNRNWMHGDDPKPANYNDAAHQCAYLHKYAMLHTALVCEHLQSAFRVYTIKKAVASSKLLNLCSLGGGPGTDIVALLLVISEVFEDVKCDVRLIDSCGGWKNVFDIILSELLTGRYGNAVKDMVANLSYKYLSADLLSSGSFISYDVHESISKADITTMIKFISAAGCRRTRQMLKEIFYIMKPGSLLLFIDNAAGGFYEMVEEEARNYGLESVFGPFRHSDYEDVTFNHTQYGYSRQFKTRVTVEMWKKSHTSLSRMYEPSEHEFRIQVEGDAEDSPNVLLHSKIDKDEEKCCMIM